MKDVRRTKNIFYILISVVIFIVVVVSLSYAFFVSQVNNNESASTITGEAANLTIEFKEGTSQISATDIFPGWTAIKTFSVINNGGLPGEYSLYVYDINNGLMDGSISFDVTGTNGGATIEKRNLPGSTTTLKSKISISGSTTHVYTVKVYYNNLSVNQVTDKGKSFSFKIGIDKSGVTNVTNLVTNGSFTNGVTGWSTTMAKTPENSVGDWHIDSKGLYPHVGDIYQFFSVPSNNKVYLSFDAISNDVFCSTYDVGLRVVDSTSNIISKNNLTCSTSNSFKTYSTIYSTSVQEQYLNITYHETTTAFKDINKNEKNYTLLSNAHIGDDNIIAMPSPEFGEIVFNNIVVLDLTETFGAGNEPTQEWCDENISNFEGTTKINY